MDRNSTTEAVEQKVLPVVLAFLDEVPPDHCYWAELTALLTDSIERIIRGYTWIGRARPEPLDVFHDAYSAIFISGDRSWNPTERNSPSRVEGLSNDWSPSMWSLYRYLTERFIWRGPNHRPMSVLEAIISNMATNHSNSRNCLTVDPSMPVETADDEFPHPIDDPQRNGIPKTEPTKTGKRNVYYIVPPPPAPPDKKAVADDEWRVLEQCIHATAFQNKKFLVAVFKHIWSWRPVKEKEDPTQEEDEWKAEYCAPEIASQFPDLTIEDIQQKIYKAKVRHLPPIAIEYEFARFLDSIPNELRELARFYRTNADTPLNVRIEHFSRRAGIPVTRVAAMHLEIGRYRDKWVDNPLSHLIKKQLGGLCNTTTHD